MERKSLEGAVQEGLGLILLFNSLDIKQGASPLMLPMKKISRDTVRITLSTVTQTFSAWPIAIQEIDGTVIQANEWVLSGYANKGEGKIGFQLLQETYRLLLEGKVTDYAHLWSPLIETTARIQNSKSKITLQENFPIYPHELISVGVISMDEQALISDSILLPLRENIVVDGQWHGTTWASTPGWHQFTIEADSVVKNYFVSSPDEWQSIRVAEQQKENQFASTPSTSRSDEEALVIERERVPAILFFILFLLAGGFLWLAAKV